MLAGQPELAVRLERAELRQLKQRVALRCELGRFSLAETAAYIASRDPNRRRRSRPSMFTREAVDADSRVFRGHSAHDQRHLRQRAGSRPRPRVSARRRDRRSRRLP